MPANASLISIILFIILRCWTCAGREKSKIGLGVDLQINTVIALALQCHCIIYPLRAIPLKSAAL